MVDNGHKLGVEHQLFAQGLSLLLLEGLGILCDVAEHSLVKGQKEVFQNLQLLELLLELGSRQIRFLNWNALQVVHQPLTCLQVAFVKGGGDFESGVRIRVGGLLILNHLRFLHFNYCCYLYSQFILLI